MLPTAIIIDLDGTLIDTKVKVSEKDYENINWEKFHSDNYSSQIFDWCKRLVNLYSDRYDILFVTSRDNSELSRTLTLDWLEKELPCVDFFLYMRKSGDLRPDHIVKKEIYNNQIKDSYFVELAIDDKISNCEMWESIGVKALYCGNFSEND